MNNHILIIGNKDQQQVSIPIKKVLGQHNPSLSFLSSDSPAFDTAIHDAIIVLLCDTADAVSTARRIHVLDDNKKMIFLVAQKDKSKKLAMLRNVVTIGHNWEVCDINSPEFISNIQSAITKAMHKKRLRTTLHSMQTSTKSQKVPYYRRLLLAEKDVHKKNVELAEKTKQLQKKITELEKWEKLTVGRELRIVELKKKVKELEGKRKR
jgi:hypothetical protein